MGAADLPRRPLSVKFLYVAIVPANACQRAKFQLPSSTSFRDKEGVLKFNVGATADLPERPLAVKFLYVVIVPANAY